MLLILATSDLHKFKGEKSMKKFETGEDINKRTDLKPLAQALGLAGNVYHHTHNQKIFHASNLEKKFDYDYCIDELVYTVDRDCFLITISDDMFEYFDIMVEGYQIFFCHTAQDCQNSNYYDHENLKSKALDGKNTFLLPVHKDPSSPHIEIVFKFKIEKTPEIREIVPRELNFICYYELSGKEISEELFDNDIRKINHVKDIFTLFSIPIDFDNKNFTFNPKEWKINLENIIKKIDFRYSNLQAAIDAQDYKKAPWYYHEIKFQRISIEYNKIIDFYNTINKILQIYSNSNDSNVLAKKDIKNILQSAYQNLYLVCSNIGHIETEKFLPNYLNSKEIKFQIDIEKNNIKYALITNTKNPIQKIRDIKFLLGNEFGNSKTDPIKYAERTLFLWKNKAEYFLQTSDEIKSIQYLEYEEEYFEFDENLFINLHYYQSPNEGKDRYMEILKKYRYDALAVDNLLKSQESIKLSTEDDIRQELKKIYENLLNPPDFNGIDKINDGIKIYIGKLNGLTHEEAYENVFDKVCNDKRTQANRLLHQLEEHVNRKNYPYLNVNDSRSKISEEELKRVRNEIITYYKQR